MPITFDPDKNERNVRERGLSFSLVAEFDFGTALVREDARRDYGERRYIAIGMIGSVAHVVVFTPRGADTRVISLRRANNREIVAYAANRP